MVKIEPILYRFECDGDYFYGTTTEIVIQMKHIEWGDTPSIEDWKSRVSRRAKLFGKEIIYTDSYSFLCSVERHGLGRFCADEKKIFF
tara:strand:- start:105 stop:368 length:264 start_codon:yes stop_codon:yes gene_type:complete